MIMNTVVFNKVANLLKGSTLETALKNIIHNYDAVLLFMTAYGEEFLERMLANEQVSLDEEIEKETNILTTTSEYDIKISKEEYDNFIGTESNDLYYDINMLVLQYINAAGVSKVIAEKNISNPKQYVIALIEVYFKLVFDNLGPVEKNSVGIYVSRDVVRRRRIIENFKEMVQ